MPSSIEGPYAPLWVKTNYSFLEGASHPEELVERAHELGLPAVAITDRDGVYGVVRAHVKARELGIRILIGAQVTVGCAEPPIEALPGQTRDYVVILLARAR